MGISALGSSAGGRLLVATPQTGVDTETVYTASNVSTTYTTITGSTGADLLVVAFDVTLTSSTATASWCELVLAQGASGSESVIGDLNFVKANGTISYQPGAYVRNLTVPVYIPTGSRLSAKYFLPAGSITTLGVNVYCVAVSYLRTAPL